MEINLATFTRLFDEAVSADSKQLIDSFYIFGSLARGEKIQAGSDIDSVLVLHNKDNVNFAEISQLTNDLLKLNQKLGIDVDHIVCTQDDLFELLSPTLIVNLQADGINIYGRDLKQRFAIYLKDCSKDQMLNSFLRTDMFRRHQLRKKYLKLDFDNMDKINKKDILSICKDIILTARDLLYFEMDVLITPKIEICSFFLANFSDSNDFVNLPMYSYNIRYGIVSLENNESKLKYLKDAFNFMERVSVLIQTKYKKVTGKTRLDLKPF